MTSILSQNHEDQLKEDLQRVEAEIAHYNEKYQVQSKRIKFLKKENEQLKEKQAKKIQNSEEIKAQNDSLKNKNKALKAKLLELKGLFQSTSTCGPKQITLKEIIITKNTQEVDLPKSQLTDDDIDSLRTFQNIRTLIVGQNSITCKGFRTICDHLLKLRKLFINHNKIADEGATHLAKLKQLRCLDLRCNHLTSNSLIFIGKLTQLTQLSISNNNLTDEGLEHLQNLHELKYLDITSNKISQIGGKAITKLIQLANLYLSHNKITFTCIASYINFKQLKVLDVRFNDINESQKEQLRKLKSDNLQMFL